MMKNLDRFSTALADGLQLGVALEMADLPFRGFGPTKGYYIYVLADPRTGLPFYIGKGKGNRALSHMRAALRGKEPNLAKAERLRAIAACGLPLIVAIVMDGLSEATAYSIEYRIIQAAKHRLTNIGPGQLGDVERFHASVQWSLAIFENADPSVPFDMFDDMTTAERAKLIQGFVDGARSLLLVADELIEASAKANRAAEHEAREQLLSLMAQVDKGLTFE